LTDGTRRESRDRSEYTQPSDERRSLRRIACGGAYPLHDPRYHLFRIAPPRLDTSEEQIFSGDLNACPIQSGKNLEHVFRRAKSEVLDGNRWLLPDVYQAPKPTPRDFDVGGTEPVDEIRIDGVEDPHRFSRAGSECSRGVCSPSRFAL